VTADSKLRNVSDRGKNRIVCSNTTRGHECTRFPVFVFFVSTGLARRADPRLTSSVEVLKDTQFQKRCVNWNRPEGPMHEAEKEEESEEDEEENEEEGRKRRRS
jgi:hypothetical protein